MVRWNHVDKTILHETEQDTKGPVHCGHNNANNAFGKYLLEGGKSFPRKAHTQPEKRDARTGCTNSATANLNNVCRPRVARALLDIPGVGVFRWVPWTLGCNAILPLPYPPGAVSQLEHMCSEPRSLIQCRFGLVAWVTAKALWI